MDTGVGLLVDRMCSSGERTLLGDNQVRSWLETDVIVVDEELANYLIGK
jgi:hypothetical protein